MVVTPSIKMTKDDEQRQRSLLPFNHSRSTAASTHQQFLLLAPPPVIPPEFLCPISFTVMEEPLMNRSGLSFERSAILDWLLLLNKKNNECCTCPITGELLLPSMLVPNVPLRNRIRQWKKNTHPKKELLQEEEANAGGLLLPKEEEQEDNTNQGNNKKDKNHKKEDIDGDDVESSKHIAYCHHHYNKNCDITTAAETKCSMPSDSSWCWDADHEFFSAFEQQQQQQQQQQQDDGDAPPHPPTAGSQEHPHSCTTTITKLPPSDILIILVSAGEQDDDDSIVHPRQETSSTSNRPAKKEKETKIVGLPTATTTTKQTSQRGVFCGARSA